MIPLSPPGYWAGRAISEYEYYEFLAVDRPLTTAEQAEVRQLQRGPGSLPPASLTSTTGGDFEGSPDQLMERWYDAHLYFGNWGAHRMVPAAAHAPGSCHRTSTKSTAGQLFTSLLAPRTGDDSLHVLTEAIDNLARQHTPCWLGDSGIGLHALASLIAQAEQLLPQAVHDVATRNTPGPRSANSSAPPPQPRPAATRTSHDQLDKDHRHNADVCAFRRLVIRVGAMTLAVVARLIYQTLLARKSAEH